MSNLNIGIIGNCGIAALIDNKASIVWCCLPRFDKDAVFHSLLGSPKEAPGEGTFSVTLDDFVYEQTPMDAIYDRVLTYVAPPAPTATSTEGVVSENDVAQGNEEAQS